MLSHSSEYIAKIHDVQVTIYGWPVLHLVPYNIAGDLNNVLASKYAAGGRIYSEKTLWYGFIELLNKKSLIEDRDPTLIGTPTSTSHWCFCCCIVK